MPRKQKVNPEPIAEEVISAQQPTEEQKEEMEKLVDELAEEAMERLRITTLCGHINKQYYNTKGRLEDLACTLHKGHTGNHEAPCKSLAKFSGEKDPAEEYQFRDGTFYLVVQNTAEWSDIAGVPAEKIRPDYEGYGSRKEWENARKVARSVDKIVE
jgi:hypothetical protein